MFGFASEDGHYEWLFRVIYYHILRLTISCTRRALSSSLPSILHPYHWLFPFSVISRAQYADLHDKQVLLISGDYTKPS